MSSRSRFSLAGSRKRTPMGTALGSLLQPSPRRAGHAKGPDLVIGRPIPSGRLMIPARCSATVIVSPRWTMPEPDEPKPYSPGTSTQYPGLLERSSIWPPQLDAHSSTMMPAELATLAPVFLSAQNSQYLPVNGWYI